MDFPEKSSVTEVLQFFNSSTRGLLSTQVAEQRVSYGNNQLAPIQKRSSFWCFLSQFTSPIILLLAAAGTLKIATGEMTEAFTILGVLLFNALLGFYQERKAEHSMTGLRNLSSPVSKVIRDGSIQHIPSSEIVAGDIIVLDSGTKIPADARLLESHNLFVDESLLSGESEPRLKTPATDASVTTILDSPNMVFSSTIVTKGRGKACVVAVGKSTQTYKIIEAANAAVPPQAPLQKKIASFAQRLSLVCTLLTIILMMIGYFEGHDLYSLTMTSISLMISAVPEGLPIAITVVLSYGLLQMAKKNAIVRSLSTIETLGSTSVICVDKTGTLTQNQMTVAELFVDGVEAQMWAHRIAYYCTETTLVQDKHVGDQLEAALMRYAIAAGQTDEGFSSTLEQPYESELQKNAVRITKDHQSHLLWKGSYESLKPLCTTMWHNGSLSPFNPAIYDKKLDEMVSNGLRVLALCVDTTMVALVGLEDPPRHDVEEVITRCTKAGIRIIIVTGDHAKTALALAKKIKITSNQSLSYLSGRTISDASDEALEKLVPQTSIFARVVPTDKLRIVKALQARGEVVAMTGDGINDAPSIRQADVGIAMGSGSDVAKESSDMVLIDNSLSCIFEAIRQGRIIFKSLQQTLCYLLTTSLGGVFTITASVLANLPIPLLPLEILFINMVTDGTMTVPLALEGEHGDVMRHPLPSHPQPLLSNLIYFRSISSALVMMLGTVTVFWYYLPSSLIHAQTMAFTTLALYQILNSCNSRSVHRSLFFNYRKGPEHLSRIPFFKNRLLLVVTAIAMTLQVAAVENSYLRQALHTKDLDYMDWIVTAVVASTIIVYAELDKAWNFFYREKGHK